MRAGFTRLVAATVSVLTIVTSEAVAHAGVVLTGAD